MALLLRALPAPVQVQPCSPLHSVLEMSASSKCLQLILIVFNITFLVFGGLIVYTGVNFFTNTDNSSDPAGVRNSAMALIGVGSASILIGLLGNSVLYLNGKETGFICGRLLWCILSLTHIANIVLDPLGLSDRCSIGFCW